MRCRESGGLTGPTDALALVAKDSTYVYDLEQDRCLGHYVEVDPGRRCRPIANRGRDRIEVQFAWPGVLLLLVASFPGASAEPYPSQRITLIVPFPPGSATDSVTRHLAESIRAATNATVVVENKPGADGNLAALAVLKAEPDGYTAFVTTNSTQAANINLFNSHPKADFAPVAGIMTITDDVDGEGGLPSQDRCRIR